MALIFVVGLTSGGFLENQLRSLLVSRIEAELLRHALLVREVIGPAHGLSALVTVDGLADRLGQSAGLRLTVIGPDGKVLGDSALTVEQIQDLAGPFLRPEVLSAQAQGRGIARRVSSVLHTEMLYVAVGIDSGLDRGSVVRAAMSLDQIDPVVKQLRVLLAIAGLLGLVLTVFMSSITSHFLSRSFRSLVEHARDMAQGAGRQRITVGSTDEIGGLAGSLNRMAEGLEYSVATLVTERDRFAEVLDGLSDAVFALDVDQRVILANSATVDILELAELPLGRTLPEIIRLPDLQGVVAQAQGGRPSVAEFVLPTTRAPRVIASATPQDATGGTVVVFHDVTELRRLELIRRDFVANVSHELRTPASVIRANVETLLISPPEDPGEGREFLEVLFRQADRLSRIIGDLLELSQIEAGEHKLKSEPVLIAALVDRAIEVIEHDRQAKEISLHRDIELEISVNADARALEQIMLNLLENAIRHTPHQGHISIRAITQENRIRFEVSDDGPGVPSSHRERIFERFFRLDAGRSRDKGGTGLGLAIVKHLVLAMGGDVGMDSVPRGGSMFWFTLPLPTS